MRFQTVFKHRKIMMAAAIIMVMLYHTKGAWPESSLKRAVAYIYFCVDIFFFCSGIGCFHSYIGRRDPVGFLGRRAGRVLPVYLPFILVWIALAALKSGISLPAALANLFGVQGLVVVNPTFNWYTSGLWVSYLLTPWLAPLAERCDKSVKAIGAVLFLLVFSVAFWGDMELIIILTRIPIFFVGMLFAAESRRREGFSGAGLALLLLLVPAGFALQWGLERRFPDLMWSCGLAWYPMLLVTPGFCLLVAAAAEALSRFTAGRAVNRALDFLGGMTFEIYLVHFWALEKPLPLFLPLTALYAAALYGVSRLVRRLINWP